MSTQLAQKEIKRYRLIEAALEQLHCGISVRKVSFHLGLSDQHLRRLFKKHLGISPKKYQKVEQFIKVKKLIESKKMNVSSALADSNYFDQSHFIHTCRELTNLSPCQYFS